MYRIFKGKVFIYSYWKRKAVVIDTLVSLLCFRTFQSESQPDCHLFWNYLCFTSVSLDESYYHCGNIHMSNILQTSVITQRRYNWVTLFLGDINTRTWPSSWESLKWDSKIGSWVLRDLSREWLLLQDPEPNARLNYRPILSERLPHIKKSSIVRQKTKIWSWALGGSPTPRQTYRLTVGRKLTSTSTGIRHKNPHAVWRRGRIPPP
jgi:hypothetical protein